MISLEGDFWTQALFLEGEKRVVTSEHRAGQNLRIIKNSVGEVTLHLPSGQTFCPEFNVHSVFVHSPCVAAVFCEQSARVSDFTVFIAAVIFSFHFAKEI